MSVVDLQELDEVTGLLAKGKLTGVLTYAEIAGAVAENDLDELTWKSFTAAWRSPRSSS